ncbi:MAG: SH3 domain-containing protein [Candidatus Devosia euplotis]|nr:SH3 domain-containing protein [Candidatus Devosia euplotis]
MLLNLATGVAVAATAVAVFLPAAYAAPGTVTTNVNVRSGPSTNYAVVSTARRGEHVDVQQRQGSRCYIEKAGADGWVSATYLSAGSGRPVNPSQPSLSFGFQISGDGPTINFGIGNQRPQRPPR